MASRCQCGHHSAKSDLHCLYTRTLRPVAWLCRYVFEVAIPPNHQQRLDLTARLTTLPNNTAPVQEGLLGRTIGALVGLALPVQDVQPQKHQANVLDEWAKERESMQKSPTVEARLRRNYRVTNLWSKDSGRSAHEHAYQDVKFLVRISFILALTYIISTNASLDLEATLHDFKKL